MTARFRDGEVVEYAAPDAASQVTKLWSCLDAMAGDSAIPCGLETARPHTSFVEAVERSGPVPHIFPAEVVQVHNTAGGRLRWVDGMAGALVTSYESGVLPEWPGVSTGRSPESPGRPPESPGGPPE